MHLPHLCLQDVATAAGEAGAADTLQRLRPAHDAIQLEVQQRCGKFRAPPLPVNRHQPQLYATCPCLNVVAHRWQLPDNEAGALTRALQRSLELASKQLADEHAALSSMERSASRASGAPPDDAAEGGDYETRRKVRCLNVVLRHGKMTCSVQTSCRRLPARPAQHCHLQPILPCYYPCLSNAHPMQAFEGLFRAVAVLADVLGQPPPSFAEDSFTRLGASDSASQAAVNQESGPQPVFEDPAVRAFYEDLPDLRSLVPAVLLADAVSATGDSATRRTSRASDAAADQEGPTSNTATGTSEAREPRGKPADATDAGADEPPADAETSTSGASRQVVACGVLTRCNHACGRLSGRHVLA